MKVNAAKLITKITEAHNNFINRSTVHTFPSSQYFFEFYMSPFTKVDTRPYFLVQGQIISSPFFRSVCSVFYYDSFRWMTLWSTLFAFYGFVMMTNKNIQELFIILYSFKSWNTFWVVFFLYCMRLNLYLICLMEIKDLVYLIIYSYLSTLT